MCLSIYLARTRRTRTLSNRSSVIAPSAQTLTYPPRAVLHTKTLCASVVRRPEAHRHDVLALHAPALICVEHKSHLRFHADRVVDLFRTVWPRKRSRTHTHTFNHCWAAQHVIDVPTTLQHLVSGNIRGFYTHIPHPNDLILSARHARAVCGVCSSCA